MRVKFKTVVIFIIISILIVSNSYAADDINLYVKSAILIDQESGRILYENKADEKRPFASLTKMMTLLIALEEIENKKVSKNDIVEISSKAAKTNGSSYKLKKGEKVELSELMKGLMVVSGNDAAVAIAEHIGGSEEDFVKMMNDKAKDIGMNQTSFINPHGLPVYNVNGDRSVPRENISTAKDLSILAKYLLDNYKDEVLSITSIKTYSNPKRSFTGNNTNALLRNITKVDGLKTGYSGQAGYCLAFTMSIDDTNEKEKNFRVIGIVLGSSNSKNRTKASTSILQYGKNNFIKEKIINKDEFVNKLYLWEMDNLPVNLVAKNDLYIVKRKNENITKKFDLNNISYPVRKGDKIGELNFVGEDDNIIGNVDLVSDSEIKRIPFDVLLKLIAKNILN